MPAKKAHMLVIGHIWPEPGTTAAGVRMMQLLRLFKEIGFEITFACTAIKTRYSHDLSHLGIEEQAVKLNDPSFDHFLLHAKPDLVLFDRFMTEEQFGWRVADTLPDCLRLLNTEDLHSLRMARKNSLKEKIPFSPAYWLNSDMAKRELASIYRSDLSLMISPYEIKFLQENASVPDQLLWYLPFLFDQDLLLKAESGLDFSEREDFVFVGNGKHSPNIDAIFWLTGEIWPSIRKRLPECRLHIYGAYLPHSVESLEDDRKGIIVEGYTNHLNDVMKHARVHLAPLRYGAGLKGKIFDAMLNGTPTVATSVGWEGICDLQNITDLDPEDKDGFVEQAVALYTQEAMWTEFQGRDQQLLKNEFGISNHSKALQMKIMELKRRIRQHRQENVVGSLLMHHSMASTRYMSKWIETKNRIKREETETSQ